MNRISRRTVLMSGAAATATVAQKQSARSADVAIYGATPGGIAAAVAAARMGRTVLLCDAEDHIGGIVSNGLTNADIGKREAVGGFFYEFTRRVVRHYQEMDRNDPSKPNVKLCGDGYWYEASAAESIFHQMIGEQQGRIRLLLSHELRTAVVRHNHIVGMTLQDSNRNPVEITAAVFIDATYEGDLAAAAKAPFRTGREARSEYNEPHAGRIYMRFRDTQFLPGSTGEADNATQAYCFRFHVTNVAAKRVPIAKPTGYIRDDYRFVLEDLREGRATKFRDIIQVYPMPNGRFELNSDHVHPDTGVPKESLDLAEACWPWPTATRAERRKIYERYKTHNVGLIWLLQNDPEVPEPVRKDAQQWGWHKDEWVANNHIPRQVYVRQGRRILGDHVLTERDADLDLQLGRTKVRPDSIAVIEWAFDPHGHHHYDPVHPGVREGYIFILHDPFQVPYGVLVPRKIDGLLVPVSCSCSHVAYNALRMEPVFMALGEASGLAAHLAIRDRVPVRGIPTAELQSLLVERKGVITFYSDLPFEDPDFAAMQWLGARGLNMAYKAVKNSLLTKQDGLERLARIMKFHGRTFWQSPTVTDSQAPLTAADLRAWLGSKTLNNGASAQLDLAAFARIVYQALKPA